ncbi:MAG: hypothetical protein JXK04_01745 [Campylobacterales bacterium]|nr:hypothetical protein [Campylobacterales bacterium]
MRPHSIRKAVLSRYARSSRPKPGSDTSAKKKGLSLEEWYHEVHAKTGGRSESVYLNKNAAEIESIMRHNRALIDSRQNHR